MPKPREYDVTGRRHVHGKGPDGASDVVAIRV